MLTCHTNIIHKGKSSKSDAFDQIFNYKFYGGCAWKKGNGDEWMNAVVGMGLSFSPIPIYIYIYINWNRALESSTETQRER